MTQENQMYNSMKAKAGQLGANAVILDAMSEPSPGAKIAAALFGPMGTGAQRKGKAVAIYVYPSEEIKNIPKLTGTGVAGVFAIPALERVQIGWDEDRLRNLLGEPHLRASDSAAVYLGYRTNIGSVRVFVVIDQQVVQISDR